MNKLVVSGLLAVVLGVNFSFSAGTSAEVGYRMDEACIALVGKTSNACVQENEEIAVSPAARKVMTELSSLIFQALEDGIKEACDEDDNFSYVVYTQKQKDISSKVMAQVEQLFTMHGGSLTENDAEAIGKFAVFIMESLIKFMEENQDWNLKFIEAKTADEALEMYVELVKVLTPMVEKFALAYEKREPAELIPPAPKVLNSDEADFSQAAVQARVTASLERLSSLMEKETQNFVDKCTDAEGNFNGKQFISLQGALARRTTAIVSEWMASWEEGIAAIDLTLLQDFVCLYLPAKIVEFQSTHADLAQSLIAASTKAKAEKVVQLHTQAIRQACKTFVAEYCSASAEATGEAIA